MQKQIFEQLQKVKIICETALLGKKFENACGVNDTNTKQNSREFGALGGLFNEKTEA
jgi:hypothetical protein